MTWLSEYLAPATAARILAVLAHSLWQAGALAVLTWVVLARLPARAASARYAICLTALFGVLAASAATWTLLGGDLTARQVAGRSQQRESRNIAGCPGLSEAKARSLQSGPPLRYGPGTPAVEYSADDSVDDLLERPMTGGLIGAYWRQAAVAAVAAAKRQLGPIQDDIPAGHGTIRGTIRTEDGRPTPKKVRIGYVSRRKSYACANSSIGGVGEFHDKFAGSVETGTVWLFAEAKGYAPIWVGPSTVTDNDGRCRFSNLPDGNVQLGLRGMNLIEPDSREIDPRQEKQVVLRGTKPSR